MAIKALIVDLDGTLVADDGSIVAGTDEALRYLHDMDVKIAIVSNRPKMEGIAKIAKLGSQPDLFVTKNETKVNKGSPRWVYYVCDKFGVRPRDILYLGDSGPDMWTAVNARVIYLNARWSNSTMQYGIQVSRPDLPPTVVRHFFLKTKLWYWQLEKLDASKRPVTAKAMINGNAAGVLGLKLGLLDWIKSDRNSQVGPLRLGDFFMLHLLGSIYLDGLYEMADWWTTYPGSKGGTNVAMNEFLDIAAKLFRDQFKPDLLMRHSPAVDSGEARSQGRTVAFVNQVNTVQLGGDSATRKHLVGKNILVIDDFITDGYSVEWARNLLLKGGAASVTSVSIGKYGPGFFCESPRTGADWDPYVPSELQATDFRELHLQGATDAEALASFRASYAELAKS